MASVDEDECVILSSSDEAEDLVDDSILMIEHSEDFPSKEEDTVEVVDEEVIVTFCKKAKLMPHARHDCTINPFERAEHETSHPLGRNAETCSECYCYICNKQAKECKYWVTPSLCHCNAHNKSKYWKGQWNFVLTGGLAAFNLDLSEIDADVQRGGRDLLIEDWILIDGETVDSKVPNRKANTRSKKTRKKATKNVGLQMAHPRNKLVRALRRKKEVFSSYLQHMMQEEGSRARRNGNRLIDCIRNQATVFGDLVQTSVGWANMTFQRAPFQVELSLGRVSTGTGPSSGEPL